MHINVAPKVVEVKYKFDDFRERIDMLPARQVRHVISIGLESSDNHFHMAIKLKKQGRWLSVRNFLAEAYGIQVNFSANHNTYYSAYKYVTKEDAEPLLLSDHPDISNELPRTEKAISVKRKNASDRKKVLAKCLSKCMYTGMPGGMVSFSSEGL